MNQTIKVIMKTLTRHAIKDDVSPVYRMEDLAIDETNLINWINAGHSQFIWVTRPHGTNLFSLTCFNADWEVTARGDHTKFKYYLIDTTRNEIDLIDTDYAISLINKPQRLPMQTRKNDFIDNVNDILIKAGLREDIIAKGFKHVLQYAGDHQIKSLRSFMERVFGAGIV